MQQFIDSILHLWPVLAAIGGGFVAVGKWLAKRTKQTNDLREKETEALKLGVQAIIRQNIIDVHAGYTERGNIPFYALESCEKLYEAYKLSGGNSFVHELMKDIRELPVTKGSQKKG